MILSCETGTKFTFSCQYAEFLGVIVIVYYMFMENLQHKISCCQNNNCL